MSVNTFYRDELNYLREMGNLFARANPRLSRFLAKEASDPDVERLLEGFAFLVGRLRQRLDAEMPEVAHGLLQLIWPHYLRPIPPITIMRFRPAEGGAGGAISVPRGTTVQSRPVEGEAVEFKTRVDLTVLPFEISAVDLDNRKDSSRLTLTFSRRSGSGLQSLAEAPIVLFFNGHQDVTASRMLYTFFRERVRNVLFSAKGSEPVQAPVTIEPVGFAPDEATLPYPPGSFSGFRIMQEYFACPDSFMFVRLKGLESFADRDTGSFSLTFEMSRPFPETSRLVPDQFAINATPAINLFEGEGQAFVISHDRTEYPVRPLGSRSARSVHAVRSVTGWVQGSGRRVRYTPFESFRHDAEDEEGEQLYYRTQIRPATLGNGMDLYVSFVTRLNQLGVPETETVSMAIDCSNGALAGKLGIGEVDRPTSATPGKLEFKNITPVLHEVPPPVDDAILWTLIANLARNFHSLIDVDALRTVVGAYDFRAKVDSVAAQQRDLLLRSFQKFERRGIDVISHGRPVRAFELNLTVSESLLGGEGEMYLFGTILDRFLKSYASINSLHLFSVTGADGNVRYKWKPTWGEAATL